MGKIGQSIWELLFPTPRICPLCGKKQPSLQMCNDCHDKLAHYKETHGRCARCGSFAAEASLRCSDCARWADYLVGGRSLWPYIGDYRKVVLDFKFHGQPWLADFLAEQMAPLVWSEAEIILPVPISKERLRERGFNQSALIAEKIAAKRELAYADDVLLKIKNTPRQSSLHYSERKNNLLGAWQVAKPEKIRGKRVLVIDDVFTTGATLVSCAEVLHAAGASAVYTLVICAGVRKGL